MKRKLFLYAWLLLMWIMGALWSWVARAADTDIVIEATSTAANQTLTVTKYFANDYMVDRWDGSPVETVSADKTHTYSTASGNTITLSLTWWADRWRFRNHYRNNDQFIPKDWTTVKGVKIVKMPSLADWFGESATNPWHNFFYNFNRNWALESLPEWSFDTSNIMTVGGRFFAGFNEDWGLTSLPVWSFDTSNITTVGGSFFSRFNEDWGLTSLPAWSFDISNITTMGYDFFAFFNYNWALESLPEWSFDTSNITTAEGWFFSHFNHYWALKSLPDWSFDTSNITTVGIEFFFLFNSEWALESLPDWSFDTSNITTVKGYGFFTCFNSGWAITSLPSSFTLNSVWASYDWYYEAFNSPNHTLNRKVSDASSVNNASK